MLYGNTVLGGFTINLCNWWGVVDLIYCSDEVRRKGSLQWKEEYRKKTYCLVLCSCEDYIFLYYLWHEVLESDMWGSIW